MNHGTQKVGGVDLIVVCEGFAPLELGDEMPETDVDWAAERDVHPWAFHGDDAWAWHVHAFALRTPHGIVMVDTGLGPFPPYRPWADHVEPDAALSAAEIDADEVRAVVHTHLHADHAGGAVVDGRLRFPNAVHHVHPADWSFFERRDDGEAYTARGAMSELDRLGMLDLAEDDHEVVPGVRVLHSPGHKPGHRSVLLETGGQALLLTGDLLHLPIQVARPEALSSHDENAAEACRSRVRLLSNAREAEWRVGVSHFARPFGRVGPDGWRSDA